MKVITNSFENQSFGDQLKLAHPSSARLYIAVAFLTDAELIEQFAASLDSRIEIVVGLSPPTSYYALKRLTWRENISFRFIRSGLHSKLYIFQSDAAAWGAVGSSNLTSGGLVDNIETNTIFNQDEVVRFSLMEHFRHIESFSEILTPEVLDTYKAEYDAFVSAGGSGGPPRPPRPRQLRSAAARSFVSFWKRIDYVKSLVGDLSHRHFPTLPSYIAIDHFWHFIVSIVPDDEIARCIDRLGQEEAVKSLFVQFADWNDDGQRSEQWLAERIGRFQSLLGKSDIPNLSEEQAIEIYRLFHAGQMQSKRLKRDVRFVTENTLESIIHTFAALLHSDERIEYRIDRALDDTANGNRLRYFGDSMVQELNGWFAPDKFPIRNEKADIALAKLQI